MFALFSLLFVSPILCSEQGFGKLSGKEFTIERITGAVGDDDSVHIGSICRLTKNDEPAAKIEQTHLISFQINEHGVANRPFEWRMRGPSSSTLDVELQEDKRALRKRMYALFPVALHYCKDKFSNNTNFQMQFDENQIPFKYRKTDTQIFKNTDHIRFFFEQNLITIQKKYKCGEKKYGLYVY